MLHGLLSVETRVGCWLFRFPAVCALDRGREFEGFGVTDEAAARLEDRCGEVLASTCGRRGDRYTQQPSSASSIAQGSPAASVVHFLVALWLASCRFLMAPFPASPVAVFCGFCFAGFMASMFSGRFAGRARIRGRSAPVAVTPLACGIRDRRTARRRRMRARPPGCRGSRPARRRWPVRC